MAKRNRNPQYWKVYHSSGISDPYRIINLAHKIIEKLGPPWPKAKRGRPPEILPELHATICITMAYMGITLRDMEGMTEPLFKRRVDHSTIDWALLQKLPHNYIVKAIKALHKKIDLFCGAGVFITDSTGIETDRYKRIDWMLDETKKREHRKLHVIAKLYPNKGVITVVSAGESDGDRNDSPFFRQIFDPDLCHDGILLGDRGYDADANRRLCYDNRLVPIIKLKDFKAPPKRNRRRAQEEFDVEIYKKYRGLVEGVFGGLETRYGNRTRFRKPQTRKVGILMMALSHNMKTYLRALARSGVCDVQDFISFLKELLDNPQFFKGFK